MNVLFIHQNMPGQFKHLAPVLASNPKNKVVFLTKRRDIKLSGVINVIYEQPKAASPHTHQYLRRSENAVRYGQRVAQSLISMRNKGFEPDIILAHPGWGESLYCKDILPHAKLVNYCEFFYKVRGADLDFDPENISDLDAVCRARTRTSHLLLSLTSCDAGVSPTEWQKKVHPNEFHSKIEVIFDGIDTQIVKPVPAASLMLPNGRTLTAKDKVVTYVARNLEPYRGFRTFMRSVPHIQRLHPDAEIVIIGGDETGYGAPPKDGNHKTWRGVMDAEVSYRSDTVHFLGRIPYAEFLNALTISSAHIYLTYPFVLSWSCLEAMACGALVIASATPPVEEVIEDGKNGILVDFFDHKALAESVSDALSNNEKYTHIRREARATVRRDYELRTCLPKWLDLIKRITE